MIEIVSNVMFYYYQEVSLVILPERELLRLQFFKNITALRCCTFAPDIYVTHLPRGTNLL